MLRRQVQEEDSVVLINMTSPEAGNGCSYGSTVQASEVPSTLGVGAGQYGPPHWTLAHEAPVCCVIWEVSHPSQDLYSRPSARALEKWVLRSLTSLKLRGQEAQGKGEKTKIGPRSRLWSQEETRDVRNGEYGESPLNSVAHKGCKY